jgi:hypothetical protein
MRSSVIKASATKTIVGSFVVLSAIVLLLNLPGLADQGSSIPRPAAKLIPPPNKSFWTISRSIATRSPNPIQTYIARWPYDFVWLKMQHNTLTWADFEKMIAACPGVGVPMVRLPDEYKHHPACDRHRRLRHD